MAYKNDDDFWNQKSDDDFWNKPVVTDEWLNDSMIEEPSEEPHNQNPYITPEQDTQYGIPNQSPYAETSNQSQRYSVPNQYTYTESPVLNGKPMAKKISGHTIVRLVFATITVLFLICLFVNIQLYKKHTKQMISTINVSEETVDTSFVKEDGGTIIMPMEAYTIIDADAQPGMPVGEKLIAVYMQHISAEDARYSSGQRTRTYIGYAVRDNEAFKTPLQSDNILPLINHLGFSKNQMLNYYNIASYYDTEGFYFFFVPQDVSQLTFYVEQQQGADILLTSSIHKKEVMILTSEQTDMETLSKEEN